MWNFIRKNNQGMALTLVLFFTMIALAIGIALFNMTKSVSHVTGAKYRYLQQLERVKGIARYVVAVAANGNLECSGGQPCTANSTCPGSAIIDLPNQLTNPYSITACLMGRKSTSNGIVRTVRITSSSPSNGERVVVDFGFLIP